MRRFIYLLIWVGLSGGAGLYLVHHHSRLVVTFDQTMVAMPMWLALLSAAIGLVALWILWHILSRLWRLPQHWCQRRAAKKTRRAYGMVKQMIMRTMVADWSGLVRLVRRDKDAAALFGEETAALEIQALLAEGSYQQAARQLKAWHEAHGNTPLYEMLRMKVARALNQEETALQAARGAAAGTTDASVLYQAWETMLAFAYTTEARRVLETMKRYKCLTFERWEQLALKTWRCHIREAAQRHPEAVENAWDAIPRRLKKHSELIAAYLSALGVQQQHERRIKVGSKAIRHKPHKCYLPLLAQWDWNGQEARLLWLISEAGNQHFGARDYLYMGSVALKIRDYSRGVGYVRKVLEIQPCSIKAYVLLADLYQHLDQPDRQQACYERLHQLIQQAD